MFSKNKDGSLDVVFMGDVTLTCGAIDYDDIGKYNYGLVELSIREEEPFIGKLEPFKNREEVDALDIKVRLMFKSEKSIDSLIGVLEEAKETMLDLVPKEKLLLPTKTTKPR